MPYLLGYKKFASNGNNFCIVNICYEYTEEERKRGCVGTRCEEIFLPAEYHDILKSEYLLAPVQVYFEKVGQKFRLSKFTINP